MEKLHKLLGGTIVELKDGSIIKLGHNLIYTKVKNKNQQPKPLEANLSVSKPKPSESSNVGRPLLRPRPLVGREDLEWTPINAKWQAKLDNKMVGYPAEAQALRECLIELAGDDALVQEYEDDRETLIMDGSFIHGKNADLRSGEYHSCILNVCQLYRESPGTDNIHIMVGYALCSDGLWRSHAWAIVLDMDAYQVIETTSPRVAYFGYILTVGESNKFVEDNL